MYIYICVYVYDLHAGLTLSADVHSLLQSRWPSLLKVQQGFPFLIQVQIGDIVSTLGLAEHWTITMSKGRGKLREGACTPTLEVSGTKIHALDVFSVWGPHTLEILSLWMVG